MELTGSIRGRAPLPLEVEVVRELSEDDLLLRRVATVGSESRPVARLRYQHHRLAQLLAGGMKPADASLLTGYSNSRISILQNDPAFRELLAHYESSNVEVYEDLQKRMAGIAMNAAEELQDRLEENPAGITNKELLETIKVTNDRGGNAPISRSQNQTVVLTAADLAAIRAEVKGKEHGRIIEAQAESHIEPEVGEGDNQSAPTNSSTEETQGLPSERKDL